VVEFQLKTVQRSCRHSILDFKFEIFD